VREQPNQPPLDADAILSLVRRCGNAEGEALGEFFERYSTDIYNFPIRVFHMDEDAASDFYLYALEHLRAGTRFRSFQGKSSFRTWFYSVLRNLVIDWLRVSKFRRSDAALLPEQTPAPQESEEEPFVHGWLSNLSTEARILVKLAFVYYLELDEDDLAHIVTRSGMSRDQIVSRIRAFRDTLSERELANLASEDKITSLYVAILDLKARRERLKSLPGQSESYEIERIDKAIEKKYAQRARLLVRRDKGHLVVRMPYREIASLLAMPEGSVSVTIMRAFDKLRELKKTTDSDNPFEGKTVKKGKS